MALPDFTRLDYLQAGNERQRLAYAELHQLRLWDTLAAYGPVLAGTIPLDVDGPGSDLDVLCEVPTAEQAAFAARLQASYGHRPGFRLHSDVGSDVTVGNFRGEWFEVEVFGQPVPVRQQSGYRHLLVEAAVLALGGEAWRRAVRQLKAQELKTEPAFARLLALPGDPYAALLALEALAPPALAELLVARAAHLEATVRSNW